MASTCFLCVQKVEDWQGINKCRTHATTTIDRGSWVGWLDEAYLRVCQCHTLVGEGATIAFWGFSTTKKTGSLPKDVTWQSIRF